MYYPGGEEDFINQYSIFSYLPAQLPKNFVSPREDGSDFVIPPSAEFESFDTGTICNDCSSLLLSRVCVCVGGGGGGGGGIEPQVGPGYSPRKLWRSEF